MAEQSSEGQPVVLSLVDQAARCLEHREWERLLELHHPQSRLMTHADWGELTPLTPSEAAEALEHAIETRMYRRTLNERWAIADHAAIGRGRVRFKRRDGFIVDEETVWLYVERDELIYRIAVFKTVAEAETAFRGHPRDLGIAD
jgi:hypothetical protein